MVLVGSTTNRVVPYTSGRVALAYTSSMIYLPTERNVKQLGSLPFHPLPSPVIVSRCGWAGVARQLLDGG